MAEYDLELKRVVREILKNKAKRVALQFPEGLKDKATEVALDIEMRSKAKVIVIADPTYGACDLKEDMCAKLGVGLLVHFGHTRFE